MPFLPHSRVDFYSVKAERFSQFVGFLPYGFFLAASPFSSPHTQPASLHSPLARRSSETGRSVPGVPMPGPGPGSRDHGVLEFKLVSLNRCRHTTALPARFRAELDPLERSRLPLLAAHLKSVAGELLTQPMETPDLGVLGINRPCCSQPRPGDTVPPPQ